MSTGCVSRGALRLAEVPPPRGRRSTLVRRAALALAALALATLALAARADAFVYWANSRRTRSGAPTWTARGANQSFISRRRRPRRGGGRRQHIYWTNAGAGTIGRANLDGTGVNHELHPRRRRPQRGGGRRHLHLLGELTDRHDRARQPRRHRASTRASSPAPAPPPGWRSTAPTSTGRTRSPAPIGRANLDGTGVPDFTGPSSPGASDLVLGVAVDGTSVYWANLELRHDRARQPRRHPASTRASSPAPAIPSGWRSTAPTSTGRTAAPARSGAPTSTARASTRASHRRRRSPKRWRSTRWPRSCAGQRGDDRRHGPARQAAGDERRRRDRRRGGDDTVVGLRGR